MLREDARNIELGSPRTPVALTLSYPPTEPYRRGMARLHTLNHTYTSISPFDIAGRSAIPDLRLFRVRLYATNSKRTSVRETSAVYYEIEPKKW